MENKIKILLLKPTNNLNLTTYNLFYVSCYHNPLKKNRKKILSILPRTGIRKVVCHTSLPIHSSRALLPSGRRRRRRRERRRKKETDRLKPRRKEKERKGEARQTDERERVGGERARKTARLALLKYNGVISREENEGRGVSFKREVFLSVLN